MARCVPLGSPSVDCIETIALRVAAGAEHETEADKESLFASLLLLLGARIARLIRQYGLGDMREDAEQVAAIGVHRALMTFDPQRARFSTHVTWQIRGELQGLRHRVRLDQRRSAISAGITTVSLDALSNWNARGSEFEIVDHTSLARIEGGASNAMSQRLIDRLLDKIGSPENERQIVSDHLFDREPSSFERAKRTSEQRRQIVRRTLRNCAKAMAV